MERESQLPFSGRAVPPPEGEACGTDDQNTSSAQPAPSGKKQTRKAKRCTKTHKEKHTGSSGAAKSIAKNSSSGGSASISPGFSAHSIFGCPACKDWPGQFELYRASALPRFVYTGLKSDKYCEWCGKELEKTCSICGGTGTRIEKPPTPYCGKCGRKLDEKREECRRCNGTGVERESFHVCPNKYRPT